MARLAPVDTGSTHVFVAAFIFEQGQTISVPQLFRDGVSVPILEASSMCGPSDVDPCYQEPNRGGNAGICCNDRLAIYNKLLEPGYASYFNPQLHDLYFIQTENAITITAAAQETEISCAYLLKDAQDVKIPITRVLGVAAALDDVNGDMVYDVLDLETIVLFDSSAQTAVPTTSTWGLVAMALVLAFIARAQYGRRRMAS